MGYLEPKAEEEKIIMAKKKRKPLSFAERLDKTLKKHQRRQEESMAIFRREQKRQGLRPDQPISLMAMVQGKKEKK